jgi:hypothetical protein
MLEYHADDTGTFHCDTEHFLMFQAGTGNAAGKDSSFFCLEFFQKISIFEIDVVDLVFTHSAAFGLGNASFHATLFIGHCHDLLLDFFLI